MLSAISMLKHIIDLWLFYCLVSMTIFVSVALLNIKFYTIENIAFLLIPFIFGFIKPVWELYKTDFVQQKRYIFFS